MDKCIAVVLGLCSFSLKRTRALVEFHVISKKIRNISKNFLLFRGRSHIKFNVKQGGSCKILATLQCTYPTLLVLMASNLATFERLLKRRFSLPTTEKLASCLAPGSEEPNFHPSIQNFFLIFLPLAKNIL